MYFGGPHEDGGYVLLVINTFSHRVELFHTVTASAEATLPCLVQIIGRYQAPLQILSDRGSHFVNDVIESLKLVRTQHYLTIVYSKEENTMAERAIKGAKRHITAMVNDVTADERDYKQYLPLIMRIMNTTTSDYIKVRPCDILYGGAINPDRGIFIPMDERPEMRTPIEHIQKMTLVQERLMKFAREDLKRHDATHLAAAHTMSSPTLYAEGSYVLLQYPRRPPLRTKPLIEGPFKVMKDEGNCITIK